MRGPGRALLLALLALGAAGLGRGGAEAPEAPEAADRDRRALLRLVVRILRELSKFQAGPPPFPPGRAGPGAPGPEPDEQRAEIVPRDLRMKDKFLKHLTGPLYFSPKCSKHFHRLYHNTRDCTIPACLPESTASDL